MAREAGIPTRRLSNGGFTSVGRGVWVTRGTAVTYDLRVRAAMLVVPDTAVVSHASALHVHGLWLPTLSDVVHVTMPDGRRPRSRAGLRVHSRRGLLARQVVHGLPVTTAGQTFLDMASLVDGDELVVVGDHLVRPRGVLDELAQVVADHPGGRFRGRAARALGLVRPGVDSPQETRLRLAIVRFGLPEPEVNLVVRDAGGEWLGRSELGYRRERVLIQYEGDVHRTSRRQWRKDIARDESYRADGWTVLRATADDVTRPHRFCWRLAVALGLADRWPRTG